MPIDYLLNGAREQWQRWSRRLQALVNLPPAGGVPVMVDAYGWEVSNELTEIHDSWTYDSDDDAWTITVGPAGNLVEYDLASSTMRVHGDGHVALRSTSGGTVTIKSDDGSIVLDADKSFGTGAISADAQGPLTLTSAEDATLTAADSVTVSATAAGGDALLTATGEAGSAQVVATDGNVLITAEIDGAGEGAVLISADYIIRLDVASGEDIVFRENSVEVGRYDGGTGGWTFTNATDFRVDCGTNQYLLFDADFGSGGGRWEIYGDTSFGAAAIVNVNSGGDSALDLAVQQTNPGTGVYWLRCYDDILSTPAFIGGIRGNGAGGLSLFSASDRTLKEAIEPLPSADALAQVLAVRVRRFRWARGGVVGIGVVHDEIAEDLPAAAEPLAQVEAARIKEGRPDRPGLVTQEPVVWALVGAVQAQQQQIADLTARIAALEARRG